MGAGRREGCPVGVGELGRLMTHVHVHVDMRLDYYLP